MRKLLDEYGNDLLDENGCVQYVENELNKIHNALLLIADYDVELLSYKGQELFNKLAEKNGE